MSSRTPEECVELALDESAGESEREDAIHELKMANECDELADLVRREQLNDEIRRRALRALDTGQCQPTLRRLTEEESLDGELRGEAEELLRDLDE